MPRLNRRHAAAQLALLLLLGGLASGLGGRRALAVAALLAVGRRLVPSIPSPRGGHPVSTVLDRPCRGLPAKKSLEDKDAEGLNLSDTLPSSEEGWAAGGWRLHLALLLMVATATTFGVEALPALTAVRVNGGGGNVVAHNSHHISGLCWSCVAIVAKPVTSALRKSLASCKDAVGHAEQVGVASLLQGLVAAGFCLVSMSPGQLLQPPPLVFWVLMAASSVLNAVIRTCETRAYAVGELSLCAPFLAFDPVMQLTVGAVVMPVICAAVGISSDEGVVFTARHAFAVASITQGMLTLSYVSSQGKATGAGDSKPLQLPRGAWLIILNCILYAFTYRLDARACHLATSTFYFACCRLLMAATCLAGSIIWSNDPGRRLNLRQFSPFLRPQVALRVLAVVFVDGFYMLSMYRAVSLISPVFVSAVKRGGGVLVSAMLGAVAFGEKLEGRWAPLLTIAVGVTLLCL